MRRSPGSDLDGTGRVLAHQHMLIYQHMNHRSSTNIPSAHLFAHRSRRLKTRTASQMQKAASATRQTTILMPGLYPGWGSLLRFTNMIKDLANGTVRRSKCPSSSSISASRNAIFEISCWPEFGHDLELRVHIEPAVRDGDD
jgi:hypothetical protein